MLRRSSLLKAADRLDHACHQLRRKCMHTFVDDRLVVVEEDYGGSRDLVLLGGQRVGALDEGDAGLLRVVIDVLQLRQDRVCVLVLLLVCEINGAEAGRSTRKRCTREWPCLVTKGAFCTNPATLMTHPTEMPAPYMIPTRD